MTNNAFYKILKFETKQNMQNWGITISVFLSILILNVIVIAFKKATGDAPLILIGGIFPITVLFSGIFTLYSYSESISKQSMQMYHLLPVSRKMKFFSKQLITFIIAPALFFLIYILFATIVNTIFAGSFSSSYLPQNIEPLKNLSSFIWSHSLFTFFGILFKKRKLVYTFVTYFALQFSISIFFVIWMKVFYSKTDPLTINKFFESLPFALTTLIPLALYFISYRLFFRRQL